MKSDISGEERQGGEKSEKEKKKKRGKKQMRGENSTLFTSSIALSARRQE
jgi:hypothetical protein